MHFSTAFVLACFSSNLVDGRVLRGQGETMAQGMSVQAHYAAQCHQKIRRRVVRKSSKAEGNVDEIVTKDGFWHVGCEKDSMFEGVPKHLDSINVSVVYYKDETPKEDRKPVTPARCFDFCRSKPDMGYFGLIHGRDCYCTPYFTNEASDDSECDAVCEGDKSQICGSMTKSSIFQMHVCGSQVVVDRLKGTASSAKEASGSLYDAAKAALTVAKNMNTDAEKFQGFFGNAGDPDASDLMQKAKQAAGDLQHAAEEAEKAALSEDARLAKALEFPLEPSPEEVKEIFDLNEKLETFRSMAIAESKTFNVTFEKYDPSIPADRKAAAQYYPVLYFAGEKENQDMPSTCWGDIVGKPKYVASTDECAASCDKEIHSCVGYQLVGKICFLFSNFNEAQYYTKCTKGVDPMASCMAKLSKFEGTTLKPDGSGKCKQCLKKLTKRDNCYAEASQGQGQGQGGQGQGQGQGGQGQGQGQGR